MNYIAKPLRTLKGYNVINELKNRFINEKLNTYDIITIKQTKKFYVYSI